MSGLVPRPVQHKPAHSGLIPESGGNPPVPAEVYAEASEIRIPRWQPWAIAAKTKLESAVLEEVA